MAGQWGQGKVRYQLASNVTSVAQSSQVRGGRQMDIPLEWIRKTLAEVSWHSSWRSQGSTCVAGRREEEEHKVTVLPVRPAPATPPGAPRGGTQRHRCPAPHASCLPPLPSKYSSWRERRLFMKRGHGGTAPPRSPPGHAHGLPSTRGAHEEARSNAEWWAGDLPLPVGPAARTKPGPSYTTERCLLLSSKRARSQNQAGDRWHQVCGPFTPHIQGRQPTEMETEAASRPGGSGDSSHRRGCPGGRARSAVGR